MSEQRMVLANALDRLVGQRSWGIKLGEGSFLTFEFGREMAAAQNLKSHGEWHLWLYMCQWRIETTEKALTGSADDRQSIESALNGSKFGIVRSAVAEAPLLDLTLNFDSGKRLRTFCASSAAEEEQWKLFTPDGNILTIFGDGGFDYRRSDQPRSLRGTGVT